MYSDSLYKLRDDEPENERLQFELLMQFRLFASLFSFLVIFLPTSNGQNLTYLGMEQGLSNSTVTSIYKDLYGFIWFGTFDGLNRFDGHTFTRFRSQIGDSTSIPDSYINAIEGTPDGKIYVATKSGAAILDDKVFKFSSVKYRTSSKSLTSLAISRPVTSIKATNKGDVFIGTTGLGLLLLKKYEKYASPILINNSTDNSIAGLAVDKNDNVWFLSVQSGVGLYNRKSGRVEIVDANLKNGTCIKFPSNGDLWVGTNSGLFKYSKADKKFIPYDLPGLNLAASRIMDITFEKHNLLWVSTDGDGLPVVDIMANKVVQKLEQSDNNSLSSNSLYTVYIDNEARKWIGTMRGGVNIIDAKKNVFKTIKHEPFNSNSLIHNTVFSFCEDGNNIWIGTDGGGISVWNRKLNSFKPYVFTNADKFHSGANQVTSIVKDQQQNIWIASYGAGVKRYDKKTGKFENIPFLQTDKGAKYVFRLFIDSDKNIWAGCIRGRLAGNLTRCLFKYDPVGNRFISEPFPVTQDVLSIAEDHVGNLWVGTIDGALMLNKKTGKLKTFINEGIFIRAVYVDKAGLVWMGTYGNGLAIYNPKTDKLKYYTEKNGLPNNIVVNIEEDSGGNIWLATFNGLSRFNRKYARFENFYGEDGLQSNHFYYNASLKLRSGELMFGGIKGFTIFNPAHVPVHKGFPPVLITGLKVLNMPVDGGSGYIKNSTNIYNLSRIVLPYEKSMFSLDFVALEYSLPEKIKYAYFLKGWDKAWNYTNNIRTLSYSRLNEGNYTLEIKSTNASGLWNSKSKLIEINVLPPWYRSWWAYCLYLALAGSAVYAYIFYTKQKAKLEFDVKLATLKAAQEAELNEKKISFFTNIAHELRSPLTLIVNPIKDLLNNDGKNINLVDVGAVHRNTKRLLSLVDQLLLFKSTENELSDLKPELLDLSEVCNEVFLCFTNQVKKRAIDYRFENLAGDIKVFADREKIEIVLFNLLSNAIKYTVEKGLVLLVLRDSEQAVELLVKNTGPVIPAETGEMLFEKFFRLDQSDKSSKKSGFGIGLFISKKIAEKQGGSLSYTSSAEVGTTFSYRIPKNIDDIDLSELVENKSGNTHLLDELFVDITDENTGRRTLSQDMSHVYQGLVEKKPKVLLVDDDGEIRAYVKQILAGSYNILEAENALEGWELLKKSDPDIVISDIVMPGISGVDFCAKIKESKEYSHIPVILLTGTSSPEVKLKGIECGADDYITKPFGNELLIARIKSILKGLDSLKKYFFNEVTLQNNTEKVSEEYSVFLKKCIEIIEGKLQDDNFNVKVFVSEMGMSHSNLFRRVKAISGLSISEFIRYIRLRKAAELMIQTDIQVKEVGYSVGIHDARYFREQFSKVFGLNPSEYIKKYRRTFLRAPGS